MALTSTQVAIVGGGFSGTMLAAQLAKRGISSALIEKAGRAGRGTAYSTPDKAHLLNVRTGMMSAWPDRPDDFRDWLSAHGHSPDGFAERRRFGDYLSEILDEAVASGLVELVAGEAVGARHGDGGWRVALADGRTIAAEGLALASGNQPPEPLRLPGLDGEAQERFVIDDPWSDDGRAKVAAAARAQAPVLIVGTGLTMVDMVLTLEAAGHDGPVVATSRRGLMPRGHVAAPHPPLAAEEVPGELGALWRWLRRRVAEGDDWRTRIDSLRPLSHQLWQGMDREEQRRFLRHARPWWDVHRHRIAPEVAAQLETRIARGRLALVAGRIVATEAAGEAVEVTIARRGGGRANVAAALIVNCTGPLGRIEATNDPLLRDLLECGAVTPDPLGIGLAADGDERAGDGLWVLGPLSKAGKWEIIAVPDIRGQAQAVAEAIEGSITK